MIVSPKITSIILTLLCLSGWDPIGKSLVWARKKKDLNPNGRSIRIFNECGAKIDVKWIHPHTKELGSAGIEDPIAYGGESAISSYVGHNFEIQELPNPSTGRCLRGLCRRAYFTVNHNEDQDFTIHKNFSVTWEDSASRATKKAREALQGCQPDKSLSPAEQIDQVAACMEGGIQAALDVSDEEILFESTVRKDLGKRLMQYVCHEDKINTTKSIHNKTWTYADPVHGYGQVDHQIQTLFESTHSSVQLVKNFFSPAQCEVLQNAATLSADSEDEDIEDVRGQDWIITQETLENNQQVAALISKMQLLTKAALNIEIDYEKETVLTLSIEEASLKVNAKSGECTLADDGTCLPDNEATSSSAEASDPLDGGRIQVDDNVMASMIILCQSPLEGGSLHFPKAGVHLRPADVLGDALLLVHEDPLSLQRDEDPFLDEYVSCPVHQGKMVTVVEHFAE